MRIFGDSCICKCASVGALLKRAMGVNLKDIYIFHKTVGALCKRALKRTEFVVAQFITPLLEFVGSRKLYPTYGLESAVNLSCVSSVRLGNRTYQGWRIAKIDAYGVLLKRAYLLALALGICCLFCYIRNVQSEQVKTWQLRGEVIDNQSHSRLGEVTVSIIEVDKTTQTDANGQFQFEAVPEGQYTLQFTKSDYLSVEQVVDVNSSTSYLQVELKLSAFQLETVTVLGSNRSLDQYEKTTDIALDEVTLEKRMGMTLANTLSDQLGISQRTMGKAVARPVIRGLGGDRLLILENGERTGDKSASSADHAVAIDPTSAKGIEVTRGPASLIYGSSTLGGVINVKRNSIPQILPEHPTMRLTFQGESVNTGLTATTGFMVPLGDFAGNLQWNRRIASDTQTPIGVLENTELSNFNFSAGTSLIKPWGFIGASGGRYRSDYGIPGSPEGHISGVNIALDRQRYDAHMEFRFNHEWINKVKFQTAYTRYEHQELESNGSLGVEFGVLTHNFSAMVYLFDNVITGMWGEYRDHATGGFYWTPHTREFALAGFYLSQQDFDRLTLQGAIRYDIRRAEPFSPGTVIQAGTVERRDFGGLSMAVSGIYHWHHNINTGATIMKTFRAPGIEELFSDGPHLAVYSYEIGNAELEPENGFGSELFAEYSSDKFKLNLTLFQNHIHGYLIPTNTGEKEWGSGAAGWLWIYQYTGRDVVMNGAEMHIETEILPRFNVQIDMSYVNGTLEAVGEPLERIPPLNGKFGFNYTLAPFQFHLTSRYSASQTRLGEFEEPTDGYIIHDAGFYLNFMWWQLENLFVFEVENILDTTYHDHLSRIKSVMPEPGRNVKFLYKLNF